MSNTRAADRRAMRYYAKLSEPGPDLNPGIGRATLRQMGRVSKTEQLRRGCLLILGRRERVKMKGDGESTRSLLAQASRLEQDRLRRGR